MVAVNCWVDEGAIVAVVGEIVKTKTLTVALAVSAESRVLVAVTVYVPTVEGDVYSPLEEIVPPVADHVNPALVTPCRVAVNCCVVSPIMVALVGESEIAVTVIVALAVIAELATLAAVMV